ncbi:MULTISPECIES: hypothetical protein [unclassified Streptomyces]|uniref:hypothetical protein n=1 Tax=unclassified Streptomyces TaxID=2593676 RepID=UPI000DD982B2|nr:MULTISPECIES: hypothetical protein [unclassified Streptomyces]QZZ25737.1 hypothetical protein A7X85_05225 [Streptomyces sp. ST1015]
MRQTSSSADTATRSPRHPHLMLAVAALAALAFTACGTEQTKADRSQSSPVGVAEARPATAFTEMLGKVAQQ